MDLPPYTQATYVIPANQFVRLSGDWDYFLLLSATDPDQILISFNDYGWQPLTYGIAIGGLRQFKVHTILLKDTSGAPNTVVVSQGGASISLSTSTALPPGASTAALQSAGNVSLASIDTKLSAPIDIEGSVANGAAIGGAGKPVLVAGSDGANVRTVLTDTGGRSIAVGAGASAAAVVGAPVRVGGSDGTNTRDIRTDTNGNTVVVGAVVSGSAVGATAPLMMAGSDGAAVQRLSAVPDNTAVPATGNLSIVSGRYESAARALTSGRVAFPSIDRGGKQLMVPCGTLDPVLAGYTVGILNAAATTNATSLKASAGMVYEVSAVNNAAYDVFIRLYNKASAPTVGTDIAYRVIRVPAGQSVTVTYPGGAYFATGIAYATTKLVAYNDTTVLVANDCQLAVQYA